MKLVVLLATILLFYTQATETKICIKEYVVTENENVFSVSKNDCKTLQGEMASEDLKDSENAKKAQLAIEKFRETSQGSSLMWLGINSKNMKEAAHPTNNPFAFSDGTEIDGSSFVWGWDEREPNYNNGQGNLKCVYLRQKGKIAADECERSLCHALCRTEEDCEDTSSKSERSRINLSVIAAFILCSIFKTF